MNLPRARSLNVRVPNLRISFDAATAREWLAAHAYWAIGVGLYVVALAALAAFLVSSTAAEEAERQGFRETITRLSGISTGAATRAGETEAEFNAIRQAFPPPDLRETDVFRAMRSLVEETDLDVAGASISLTSDVARQSVGSTTYRVMTFKIGVSGDFDDVWGFIQRLDQGKGPYRTLVLDSASFGLSSVTTADLEFTLYVLPEGGG